MRASIDGSMSFDINVDKEVVFSPGRGQQLHCLLNSGDLLYIIQSSCFKDYQTNRNLVSPSITPLSFWQHSVFLQLNLISEREESRKLVLHLITPLQSGNVAWFRKIMVWNYVMWIKTEASPDEIHLKEDRDLSKSIEVTHQNKLTPEERTC